MMEETNKQEGNTSIESLPSSPVSPDSSRRNSEASDGIRETINPLNINNGLNTIHHDLSTNKHSFRGVGGVQARSPEPLNSSTKLIGPSRTLIDTAAPFQSVKAAVNMFGGNVDWKTQRTLAKERNRNFEQELEKAEQEVPLYLKQLEEAEDAKTKVLQELEIAKKQLEELKLQLDKTQTEQSQAQQDCELAQLRVEEIEQGISKDESVAAKAQVEVAKTRNFQADNELKSVEIELETLQKECDQLTKEKDIAVKKSEEAVFASNEIEKKIEELTIELISAKEAVELAQASNLKAEQQRLNATMEREHDTHNWESQLKQSQEKLQSLEENLSFVNDLKLKLDSQSTLLTSLKLELAAYVETILRQEADIFREEQQKKELEVVNSSIQKAKDEVNCLRIAASSLKSELETETQSLDSLKKMENLSLLTISSLQSEFEKNQTSHEDMQELQDKTEEANQAKSQAHSALQELTKAMEEARLAKASTSTMELKLQAVLKEIEATKASEKLSLDAIKAVTTQKNQSENIQEVVTIPSEEYYSLSKKANEVERLANERIIAAVDQIKDFKRRESMNREKLEASYKEIKERKEELRYANEKAENAEEVKLKIEQEMKEWKESDSSEDKSLNSHHYCKSFDESKGINCSDAASIALRVNSTPIPNRSNSVSKVGGSVHEVKPSKKKSFFPRLIMSLAARKKTQPLN